MDLSLPERRQIQTVGVALVGEASAAAGDCTLAGLGDDGAVGARDRGLATLAGLTGLWVRIGAEELCGLYGSLGAYEVGDERAGCPIQILPNSLTFLEHFLLKLLRLLRQGMGLQGKHLGTWTHRECAIHIGIYNSRALAHLIYYVLGLSSFLLQLFGLRLQLLTPMPPSDPWLTS